MPRHSPHVASRRSRCCSCGGDATTTPAKQRRADASGAQPAAVKLAQTAAGPNAKASSGVISGGERDHAQGRRRASRSRSRTSVSGPFQYRKGAALPDYELELGVARLRRHADLGRRQVVRHRRRDGLRAARLDPPAARAHLGARQERADARRSSSSASRRGAGRPSSGSPATETIDGVETTHIATSFNAGRILQGREHAARPHALARRHARDRLAAGDHRARARRVVVRGVTTKAGASWIGVPDTVLRQAGLHDAVRCPEGRPAQARRDPGGTSSASSACPRSASRRRSRRRRTSARSRTSSSRSTRSATRGRPSSQR